VRARRSWDFALAGAALVLELQGLHVQRASVFLSGAAPYPWHAQEVEQAIIGQELTQKTIQEAAEAVVSRARPLVRNAYKIPLLKGIIREELQRAAEASRT